MNRTEKLKFAVAALTEVKQKLNTGSDQSSKKQCTRCNKLGHEEPDCYIAHPEKHPQNCSNCSHCSHNHSNDNYFHETQSQKAQTQIIIIKETQNNQESDSKND